MAWTSQRLGLRSSLMDARATKLRTGEESQCALLAAQDLPVFPDSSTNLFLLSTLDTEQSPFPPNPRLKLIVIFDLDSFFIFLTIYFIIYFSTNIF